MVGPSCQIAGRSQGPFKSAPATICQKALSVSSFQPNSLQRTGQQWYSVSHDLRAPLRAVDGFSMVLLQDYGDKLDHEGQRLLNIVRENATKMNAMIDGILALSRIGRAALNMATVDMEAMVR